MSLGRNWKSIVALALMLLAIFAYVASLDESDPDAVPEAVGEVPTPSPQE